MYYSSVMEGVTNSRHNGYFYAVILLATHFNSNPVCGQVLVQIAILDF